MKKNYKLTTRALAVCFSAFLLFSFSAAFAQPLCPNATDLTSPYVKAYTGVGGGAAGMTGVKGYPFDVEGLVLGRHTIINTPGTDPRTGGALSLLPNNPPGSVPEVVKLGNENAGYEAEAIVYTYEVDRDNPILIVNFAIVLQDPPGHPFPVKPRFIVRVVDPTTIDLTPDINGKPINPLGDLVEPCAEYDVTADGDVPGFQPYQKGSWGALLWRDWTKLGVDLTKFAGQEVAVQFITYDCGYGAHFGYCYFTASCHSYYLETGTCGGGTFTLEAPDIYNTYLWSNGETTPTATFDVATWDLQHITCVVTTDMGCDITLRAYATSTGAGVFFGHYTDVICEGETYTDHSFDLPPQPAGQWFYKNLIFNPEDCTYGFITLDLEVIPRLTHYKAEICYGQDYTENGFSFIKPIPGVYHDSYKTGELGTCDLMNVLELTVNATFENLGEIEGDTDPCTGVLATYSFAGTEVLTKFNWILPPNTVVVKGNLYTPQITIYFTDDTPGDVEFWGKNGCGQETKSFPVAPRPSYNIQINDAVCQGDVYNNYGFNLGVQKIAGSFVHVLDLTSSQGCDSTVTLALQVNPKPLAYIIPTDPVLCNAGDEITLLAITESDVLCDHHINEPDALGPFFAADADAFGPGAIFDCDCLYEWTPNGETTGVITDNPMTTTTYTVTVTTGAGCTATASQVVIVNTGNPVVLDETICKGETYSGWGITETTSGDYQIDFVSSCGIIDITVKLTVTEPEIFPITGEYCAGDYYTDHGFNFVLLQDGIFRDTIAFIGSSTCDSLVVFELTVNPTKKTFVYDNVCQFEKYIGNGFDLGTQMFAGEQTYTRNNESTLFGCDSTVVLKLMVYPIPVNIVDFHADTVCVGEFTTLTNWSIYYDASLIDGWEWYLDGEPTPFSTIINPPSTKFTVGTHNITLKVLGIGGCDYEVTKEILVRDSIIPTFALDPTYTYCVGETVVATLPTTSNNTPIAVTGTWSPSATIDVSVATGPVDYIFTPAAGECAKTFKITVTVENKPLLEFPAVEYCEGGTLPTFPSTGGVTGTWSPTTVQDATQTYTFTPATGVCAIGADWVVTKKPKPTVTTTTSFGPICSGEATDIALTSSPAGTTYTWAATGTGVSGFTASGSGTPIQDVLTLNTGVLLGNVVYTVTPTLAGCIGDNRNITVTVEPCYNVTYDCNGCDNPGNTPIDPDNPYFGGNQPNILGPNGITKDCHVFLGWAYSPTATTPDFVWKGSFTPPSFIITKDVTLYAVWKYVCLDVTYDCNGCDNPDDTPTDPNSPYVPNSPVSPLVPGDMFKDCHIFKGWAYSPTATTPDFKWNGDIFTPPLFYINKNTQLYAVWEYICTMLKCVEKKGSPKIKSIAYEEYEYIHPDNSWDVMMMPPPALVADYIKYVIDGTIEIEGPTATLAGTRYTVGVHTIEVYAYSGEKTDFCEFTVTIKRDCPKFAYDCQGNEYKVTELGGYCWTENITATNYSAGETECDHDIVWSKPYLSNEYSNTAFNSTTFGKLYSWYSALGLNEDGSGLPYGSDEVFIQGICPYGYHIPSLAEWESLKAFSADDLKSENYWLTPGSDIYGWDARPAGWHSAGANKFVDLYGKTGWWAAEGATSYLHLGYYYKTLNCDEQFGASALSVRCILNY